ncbi:hypothetical protein BJ138DRAFT_1145476 [Hygrophoropsis aurantiaca]|uniref:Uncharacterized protein n=1 Tax=Hygrophoropsis aurantiaca TaxID=72124 RepID=A0ACB8AJZ0_9AGAM|nr:hypothetical protein BJ138DRAFT_1145476 [Hygrophoropsis aurantiaca]
MIAFRVLATLSLFLTVALAAQYNVSAYETTWCTNEVASIAADNTYSGCIASPFGNSLELVELPAGCDVDMWYFANCTQLVTSTEGPLTNGPGCTATAELVFQSFTVTCST